MALSYDNASTGIFTHIGILVKYIDSYSADITNLETDRDDIQDKFDAGDQNSKITELFSLYENAIQSLVSLRGALAQIAEDRLRDRDTVINELELPNDNINSVLSELITQMNDDSESVDASAVTLGAVTADSGNNGTGLIVLTKVLDGITPPGGRYPEHLEYNALDSQLAFSETMTLRCLADEDTDGATQGEERFSWDGEIPRSERWGTDAEGSGNGPILNTLNSNTLIANRNFENFTSDVPDDWDRDAGTATTHMADTTTAAKVFRGSTALNFIGDGSQASIQISQDVSPTSLTPRLRYLFSLAILADASVSNGDFTAEFNGTGYTPASETVDVKTVQISGTPTGGNYTLTVIVPGMQSVTTGNIAHNANSAAVQTALRALTGLESVTVTTSAGSPPDVTHQITFTGVQGSPTMTCDISGLTGGSPAQAVATTTPGVEGERIYLPAASLPTTYSLRHFWINLPNTLPDDWEIVLKWTGTPTNTKNLYLDSLAFGPAVWHGGIGAAVLAGSTQFIRGDKFTSAITNDEAGTFQTFFRRQFGVQLPSNASGSETIADSLAE